MGAESNSYSQRWFEFFHARISEARTTQEAAFVCRCLPLPDFRRVADVCCGMGRHARALARLGYAITGIERDVHAIARARELGGGPTYVQADIRDYSPAPGAFDAAIVMSQSFGYFDAPTNREMLGHLAASVRAQGRIILDLWSREFFAAHQGEREFDIAGARVRESKHLVGDRLVVQLDYPDGSHDRFDWQLFSPTQLGALAESVGLAVLHVCTDFDIASSPVPDKPRIQFVLECCRR